MKNALRVVTFALICGIVLLAASGNAANKHSATEVQPVNIDRSQLLERLPVAGAEKAGRATAIMGPLVTLLGDGGAAYIIGFGTTTFFQGYQWNAPADFPTSWFPFTVANVRAWAGPDQGATAVVFGARQVGQTSTVTVAVGATATTIHTGSLTGANVAAGGFSAGVQYQMSAASAPRVRAVWRCATGTAVAAQQANQRWFSPGTLGGPFYNTGTCSGLIGVGGAYPLMVVTDAIANGAGVPVELMTFQVD